MASTHRHKKSIHLLPLSQPSSGKPSLFLGVSVRGTHTHFVPYHCLPLGRNQSCCSSAAVTASIRSSKANGQLCSFASSSGRRCVGNARLPSIYYPPGTLLSMFLPHVTLTTAFHSCGIGISSLFL